MHSGRFSNQHRFMASSKVLGEDGGKEGAQDSEPKQ